MKINSLKIGENALKLKLAPNKKVDRAIKKDARDDEAPVAADGKTGRHGGGGSSSRKARLIVRNLSFKATDKSMQGHFAKEIHPVIKRSRFISYLQINNMKVIFY